MFVEKKTFVLSYFLLLAPFAFAQKDVKGSSDHPLFPTRMPGFYISSYQQYEFDKNRFKVGKESFEIEGKKTVINYYKKTDAVHPGALSVLRNYQNAAVAKGGEILHQDDKRTILKLRSNGSEAWVEVEASRGPYIYLTIVERVEMKQVIQANLLFDALNTQGFIALDIHFESGKSEIQEASFAQLDEVANLLKANEGLKLSIEGHTDNQGDAASNKKLSDERAKSVHAALVNRGIESKRLKAVGYGQERPIADNRLDEGRAKNRRVELVKI